jgi:hypothetical protein
VRHNQNPELGAKSQEHEPILLLGMVGIMFQSSVFIGKSSGCFLKRNPVLAEILSIFSAIP